MTTLHSELEGISYTAARAETSRLLALEEAGFESSHRQMESYQRDASLDKITYLRRQLDALKSEAMWTRFCMERRIALKLARLDEPDFSTGALRDAYAHVLRGSRAAYACLQRYKFTDDEKQRARVQSRRVREWVRESLTKEK